MTATPSRHVAKDGAVTWKVRFRYGVNKAGTGKRQASETFGSKKDADRFARLVHDLGPQEALDQLYEAEQQATVPSLDTIAAEHIEHLTGITDGTRLTYARLWKRVWSPRLA